MFKLKEFAEVINEGIDAFEVPRSLIQFLGNELLLKPAENSLWPYEVNRIRFSKQPKTYLDRAVTKSAELTMLAGLFIVAKFMIVKVFLNSAKYSNQLSGV